jgi:arylformamidase
MPEAITDWNDAYANGAHIPQAEQYIPRWQARALAFREHMLAIGRADLGVSYGNGERQHFDAFWPEGAACGVAVFVHGGYWKAFDASTWSHLAQGALSRGWVVAMPTYTLAPQARIGDITREIGQALVAIAEQFAGPIALAGHSAGGHLVTRMLCTNAPVQPHIQQRIRRVLSISGVHDLRPLLHTDMNAVLQLDATQATAESPALLTPVLGARLCAWVGTNERPEFIRQTELLANIWHGLGLSTEAVQQADRHHFDVIDDLADGDSEMVQRWLGE